MHRNRRRCAAVAAASTFLLTGAAFAAATVKTLPTISVAQKSLPGIATIPTATPRIEAKKPRSTAVDRSTATVGKKKRAMRAANPAPAKKTLHPVATTSRDKPGATASSAGPAKTARAASPRAFANPNAEVVTPRKAAAAPTATVPRGVVVLPRLAHLEKRLAGIRAKHELEQAGLGPDVGPRVGATDPMTGNPLTLARPRAATNPLTGEGVAGSRNVAARDPRSGRSLLGGDDGDGAGSGPGPDDAREAGRKGRGMAMSDDSEGETTNDDTKVYYEMTYGEASTGGMDGDNLPSPAGTRTGTIVTDGDVVWVKISDDEGNYVLTRYERGKKPVQTFGKDDKPRPDDAGSAPRPSLTEEEQRRLAEEMPKPVDIAGQPVDDDDAPRMAVQTDPADWMTDLVLAGQPVDDSTDGGRGAPPAGAVPTDLGLAGQPVDDDPDFGTITPGSGRGGFGSAARQMKRAALALGGRRLHDAPSVTRVSRDDVD